MNVRSGCIAILIAMLGGFAAAQEARTEIGDYLQSGRWKGPAGGGLRVDSLAEDTTYSSRYRGEPPRGWVDKHRSFLHWLPPLTIPEFSHSDPDDPLRHLGIGHPLEGTSWRNRAYHVGWLFGGLFGDDLVGGEVQQTNNMFGGYRIGWDFDHYWGCEGRFAFAKLNGVNAQTQQTMPASRNQFYDISLAYYPWGDARWRPYASAGLGWARFSFTNADGVLLNDHSFTLPIAFGLKYYWKKFMSLRGELSNNIAFSSDKVDTSNSVSLTFGLEYRFGHPHRVYSW